MVFTHDCIRLIGYQKEFVAVRWPYYVMSGDRMSLHPIADDINLDYLAKTTPASFVPRKVIIPSHFCV